MVSESLDLGAIEARYSAALDARPSKGRDIGSKGYTVLTDAVADIPDLLAALAEAEKMRGYWKRRAEAAWALADREANERIQRYFGDERCARCGDPLPGANSDNLDVCVPCDTIVSLEVERDELLAKVDRVRALSEVWRQEGKSHGICVYAEGVLLALDGPELARRAYIEAARKRREVEAGGT